MRQCSRTSPRGVESRDLRRESGLSAFEYGADRHRTTEAEVMRVSRTRALRVWHKDEQRGSEDKERNYKRNYHESHHALHLDVGNGENRQSPERLQHVRHRFTHRHPHGRTCETQPLLRRDRHLTPPGQSSSPCPDRPPLSLPSSYSRLYRQ